MASHGLKNIALALGVLLIGSASQAQPVPPKLPSRPAPVSGKVGSDPAAAATPVVATSTARQVPPPANLNEPLLKPEAELVPAAHAVSPAGSNALAVPAPAASPVKDRAHVSHTEGQKVPEAAKGHKKAGKSAGHAQQVAHADAASAAKHGKKSGKTKVGPLGKRGQAQAQASTLVAGHAQKVSVKAHPTAHQKAHLAGAASDKVSARATTPTATNNTATKAHKKSHASTQAVVPAPTVSTAHELKPTHQHKAGKRTVVAQHHKAGGKVGASVRYASLSDKRKAKVRSSHASAAKPTTPASPNGPKAPKAPKKPAHPTVAA